MTVLGGRALSQPRPPQGDFERSSVDSTLPAANQGSNSRSKSRPFRSEEEAVEAAGSRGLARPWIHVSKGTESPETGPQSTSFSGLPLSELFSTLKGHFR